MTERKKSKVDNTLGPPICVFTTFSVPSEASVSVAANQFDDFNTATKPTLTSSSSCDVFESRSDLPATSAASTTTCDGSVSGIAEPENVVLADLVGRGLTPTQDLFICQRGAGDDL